MKRLVEIQETNKTAFEALLGETVWVLSGYFYYGKLTGINDTCIALTNAKIVFAANDFKNFDLIQELPANEWFVSLAAIESFGKAE